MSLFHDEEDGNPEPIEGLPDNLPDGERIVWQGKPDALTFAIHAFHIRFVALYFLLFTLWRITAIAARDGAAVEMIGVATTSLIGAGIGIGLLTGIAWLMARATIYTITNRRVVFRYGVAIRKYVNIPFKIINTAALKRHNGLAGSIALATEGKARIAYLHLWPHTRPFRYSAPEPMLRALPNADDVAQILCDAIKSQSPTTVTVKPVTNAPRPTQPRHQEAAATA